MRQVHREEVDLALDTSDHRKRLTEVHLGMARLMGQRHVHLPLTLSRRKDIILHNRDATGKAVLIAETLKDPLRGMALLLRPLPILL